MMYFKMTYKKNRFGVGIFLISPEGSHTLFLLCLILRFPTIWLNMKHAVPGYRST